MHTPTACLQKNEILLSIYYQKSSTEAVAVLPSRKLVVLAYQPRHDGGFQGSASFLVCLVSNVVTRSGDDPHLVLLLPEVLLAVVVVLNVGVVVV